MAVSGLSDVVVSAVNNYKISNSLQFRTAANTQLVQYNVNTGNRKTFTFATWIKIGTYNFKYRSALSQMSLFDSGAYAGGVGQSNIRLDWSEPEGIQLTVYDYNGSGFDWQVSTDRKTIDTTAWMHLCIAVDTTQSVAADRVKIYWNGVRETAMSVANYPSLNYDTKFNTTDGPARKVGRTASSSYYAWENFDGVMADTHFIDGYAVTADAFGVKTDFSFEPRRYTGPYGPNGFFFNYSDLTTVENILGHNIALTSNTQWATENSSLVANSGIAPDGSNTATKMVAAATTTIHGIRRDGFSNTYGVVPNSRYAISAYFKPQDYPNMQFSLDANSNDSNTVAQVTFYSANTTAVVTSGGANTTGEITYVANGWYRATMAINASSSPAGSVKYRWDNGAGTGFTGDSVSGGLIWGFQIERTANNSAGPLLKTGAGMAPRGLCASVDKSVIPYGYNTMYSLNHDFSGSNTFTYDVTYDSPSMYSDGTTVYGRGNYCTLHCGDTNERVFFDEAGTRLTSNSSLGCEGLGTIRFPWGKFYFEVLVESMGTSGFNAGVIFYKASGSNPTFLYTTWRGIYTSNSSAGRILYDGGMPGTNATGLAAMSNNDVLGIAVDTTIGEISFYKNNTLIANTSTGGAVTAENYRPLVETYNTSTLRVNYGRVPFKYTPPTGFISLNTNNLPTPTIKRPSEYFDIKLWTGNGASTRKIPMEFSPSITIIKNRSANNWWATFDAHRGGTKTLFLNAPFTSGSVSTEYTNNGSGWIDSFDSDGITLNHGSTGQDTNASGSNFIGYNWRESIAAGCDVVSWVGNGISGRTISHNLGTYPELIIAKCRSIDVNWRIFFSGLGGYGPQDYNLLFDNQTAYSITGATTGGGISTVSPTNFTVVAGTANQYAVNENGHSYIAYCFSRVHGFSDFGAIACNGSVNGPFIYTGFKPKFVMIKTSSGPNVANDYYYYQWICFNSESDNDVGLGRYELCPSLDIGESGNGTDIWYTSNGFKLSNWGAINDSGAWIQWAAWADVPFKNARGR